jgi:hypothetical protein
MHSANGKRGRVEECSVTPLRNKGAKTLSGCRGKRVQSKEKYKLRLTTKAYKLSYNHKLHHKSSWQIVWQVASQALAFWWLKEG